MASAAHRGAAPRRRRPRSVPLAVRVQPAGASILVDGERWEGSDTSGERLLVQLAEGRHRVEVQRDGYQPYATDVEVRSGETATLNVSLPQERQ